MSSKGEKRMMKAEGGMKIKTSEFWFLSLIPTSTFIISSLTHGGALL
jgi:hypothetical protein